MELRQLRYFVAVAETQSFTRGAEAQRVAQPALSRQVRALEEELGVELLERSARPVKLTEAGRICFEQASQILSGIEQLRHTMENARAFHRSRFVIGVVGSIMHGAMPRIIRAFREQHPGIDVELIDLLTLEQVEALKTGRIDAGLGRIRIDDPVVRRQVLFEEPLLAALPSDDPLADKTGPLSLADLSNSVLIAYPSRPRPSYADQVLSRFRDHGVKPRRITEVREIQTALGLVASGAGVAVVPSSMKRMNDSHIVYRPLSDADATSPVILSQRLSDTSIESINFRDITQRVLKDQISEINEQADQS